MPATDFQGSSSPLANLGRSILSLRRDQVPAAAAVVVDGIHHDPNEPELDSFQRQIADRFSDLSSASSDDLLSLDWVRKLLDVFLICQEEFRVLLYKNRAHVNKPPTDRLVAEFYERTVKALDVCNAIRDGVEQIRQWQKFLEIVMIALNGERNLGEGQFRRAKKALVDLAIGMLDEKESSTTLGHRNRSFGRNNASKDHKSLGHFRSLSWSVSRSWSAARQLQAIANNLYQPKGNEIAATNGLAVAVYAMSSVLLFVMWALVAAIPCQDRGLQVHFSIPRHAVWGAPIMVLHDRIVEESKKRERKNACGLLKEIYQLEKGSRLMSELVDSAQFPLTEEKESEVKLRVQELAKVNEAFNEGLDPLERQVREVFHRIVRNRTDGLDSLGRANSGE